MVKCERRSSSGSLGLSSALASIRAEGVLGLTLFNRAMGHVLSRGDCQMLYLNRTTTYLTFDHP